MPHLGLTGIAISGNGIKIIDSSKLPTTLAKTRSLLANDTEAPPRQNPRQRFVTSDLFLCSLASSPRPSSIIERAVGARAPRLPTAHGPTANYLFLSQRVITVQMAELSGYFWLCAIFGRRCLTRMSIWLQLECRDIERFVVVLVVVAVFVAAVT